MLYSYIMIALGLLSSFILFSKFPFLKRKNKVDSEYKLSIIIPARNEEENISLLLKDLTAQLGDIHEIICVDDCSTDGTYEVISSFDVKIVSIQDKPDDWTGKAWACQKGAESATGDILLFLDADVRLSSYAISSLINSYDEKKSVISVQPYHNTYKYYEQFSFFFNMIQISANGTSIKGLEKNVGLYGPVILIDLDTYTSIDGHLSAKDSIVDDVTLGETLNQMGLPFKLFMGGRDISFRMYGDNLKSLFQGWRKNYATGALKTPLAILGLVILWVASCISSVIILIQSVISLNITNISIAIIFYISWVLELFRISGRIGRFKKSTIIVFPIYLVFLFLYFLYLYLKNFSKEM